jgi:hypothetical protein
MFEKQDWWADQAREIFWCEITDREDIGSDLKCPQTNEKGLPSWSYSLINQVLPGDIVFHYSTRQKAFVGASIAGAPLQSREIVWVPHSLSGHKKTEGLPRPGWWLPLHTFLPFAAALPLSKFREPENQDWIERWIRQKRAQTPGPVRLPFQLYPRQIRGAQGYLMKMPLDFVNHWPQFTAAAERLSITSEHLAGAVDFNNPEFSNDKINIRFSPKDDSDYVAFIKGGSQRRSRQHETLVHRVGNYLSNLGAKISNPHPIDLLMLEPHLVIFEMKIVDTRSPSLSIREAVGQLFEYRYYFKLPNAYNCIVLECDPGPSLISYVENELNFGIAWFSSGEMYSGPKTSRVMPNGASIKAPTAK